MRTIWLPAQDKAPRKINILQAAAIYKCSRRTIYNLINDGSLQAESGEKGQMILFDPSFKYNKRSSWHKRKKNVNK